MSNLEPRKAVPVDVPGLAYFVAETAKPVKSEAPQGRVEVVALEQMYGYFTG